MKQTITARQTIPNRIFLENGGLEYLQRMINITAEGLKGEHGYSKIEYIDHQLEEGYLDTADADHLSFVVTFRVG